MKYKVGSIILFGGILALILSCAFYILNGKQPSAEDVYGGQTKEKDARMMKAPTPIWETVIRKLVRF